jgi:hypothetical protein
MNERDGSLDLGRPTTASERPKKLRPPRLCTRRRRLRLAVLRPPRTSRDTDARACALGRGNDARTAYAILGKTNPLIFGLWSLKSSPHSQSPAQETNSPTLYRFYSRITTPTPIPHYQPFTPHHPNPQHSHLLFPIQRFPPAPGHYYSLWLS